MDYNVFHNCLRLQITPDDRQDERINDLVIHCKKYGFDNVMLMLNLEEFNVGHITIKDVKIWVDLLKKAKVRLQENGITVSVNNWIEMGHADRGRTFYDGQDFLPMTDMKGNVSTFVTCPLGEKWQDYYVEYVTHLTRELSPDTFWIEDDFRLHNHAPLVGVGCYCPKHLEYYNDKLNANYTREQFLSKAFEKGKCNEERKVLLDANREVMLSLAKKITKAVKAGCQNTDVALMSSTPDMHCLEARDWESLFDILSDGGRKINRIHLCYWEPSGKDFLYYFNSVSMAIRSMADDSVLIMPEIEHGAASVYGRSPRYLRFVMESAIPLILSGMTYSIYDFIGNGVRESFGYGEEIKKLKPYMQAVMNLGLKFSSLKGVVVPIDQDVCYKRKVEKDYQDLMPTEYHLASYLSGLGITYRYSREKSFDKQVVFICGSSVDCFTDEELKKLFKNNFVLIEGTGVLALEKRNLLELINAKSARFVGADTGYHTYEEVVGNEVICGVKGLRASCRAMAGDFVKVDYVDGINVKSQVKNQYMQTLAPSFTVGKNFAVLPYCINKKLLSQFCDLRRYLVSQVVMKNAPYYVVCENPGVSPYLYKMQKGYTLILSNGNVDSYTETRLQIGGFDFAKVSLLDKNGKKKKVKFTLNNGVLIVKTPMEYLSTTILILE